MTRKVVGRYKHETKDRVSLEAPRELNLHPTERNEEDLVMTEDFVMSEADEVSFFKSGIIYMTDATDELTDKYKNRTGNEHTGT